jgi:hypothetical protein
MPIVTLQVTIPSGGKVQVSTSPTSVRFIDFQNNGATNAMRVGDSTVSSTVGHNLVKSGGELAIETGGNYFCYLSDWWVAGTSADVLDITFAT